MKKFILILAACALFAACTEKESNPSSSSDPVATHFYTISTDDYSWSKADLSYIDTFFTDDSRIFTIENTLAAADSEALAYYWSILDRIDNQRVCNAFPCEYDSNLEEHLFFQVDLMRTEGRPDTLAIRRWNIDGVRDLK